MKLTETEEEQLKKAGFMDETEENQEILAYKKLYDISDQWFKEHSIAGSLIRLILSITGYDIKKKGEKHK